MPETPPNESGPRPTLQFDWQEWLPYIADSDLTDTQKREMIEALESIVIAFVDLQWRIADAPKETCGQTLDLRAALETAVLNSKTSSKSDDQEMRPIFGPNDAAKTPNKKEPV